MPAMNETNPAPKPATNVVPIRPDTPTGGLHMTDFLTLVVFSLLDQGEDGDGSEEE